MSRLSSSARRTVVSLAAVLLATGVAMPSAGAATTSRWVDIRGSAECDPAAGQWKVTWSVASHAEAWGTLGNVRAYPAGRALVGMPNRLPPGATIAGEQRLLPWENTGSIALDINWDDGPVTYDHSWPIYIKIACHA